MLEVELKAALLPEQADVLPNVLAALHFAEQAAVQETDIYFNAPDRDFRKTDEALRLRTHSCFCVRQARAGIRRKASPPSACSPEAAS